MAKVPKGCKATVVTQYNLCLVICATLLNAVHKIQITITIRSCLLPSTKRALYNKLFLVFSENTE